MALGKAMKFIKQVAADQELRKRCYEKSKEELLKEMDFNETEFEDAINMELVKCQSYDAADHVQQIKMWFSML